MPVFDFKSPGAEASRAIQAILTQRRVDSRQAMLDKLAREEQTSVQAAREAQTAAGIAQTELARTAEARQTKATDSDIAVNQAQIAAADEGRLQNQMKNIRRGARPEDITDERLREAIRSRAGFESKPMFGPPVEGQAAMPVWEGYRGTPEEQRQEEIDSIYDTAIGELPETANPNAATALRIQKAGGTAPAAWMGPSKTTLYDPDRKTFETIDAPPGSLDVLPRRPLAPAGYLPNSYQVVDKDNNFVKMDSVPQGGEAAWQIQNPGMQLRPVGWKPTDDASRTGISTADISILASTYQAYQAAQGAYDNSYGDFGRDLSGAAARAKNTYERVVGGVAAKAKISPAALEAANVISNDPELRSMDLNAAVAELDGLPADLNMEELQKALLLFGNPSGQ